MQCHFISKMHEGAEIQDLWAQTIAHLQASVPAHAFHTWLKPITCRSADQERILLEVPNTFYRQRILEDYAELIQNKLREISRNSQIRVWFSIPENLPDPLFSPPSRPKPELASSKAALVQDSQLLQHYTFDAFVVGTHNQFAHAASKAVAQDPGKKYNPLFIYGGVGLGKTHLLCAVGNHILSSQTRLRVLYRSSEQFTNELIHAIRYEKTQDFRNRYRNTCDVLLLDDIHFLSGKERTQEEFFHTFNTLHQLGRQVVLTSDRLPENIPDLDERLRSRFQWGLFCDIQPPDVETRIAILKKKAEAENVELPDDVALFLAHRIRSNIRVLEGSLIRIAARASLFGKPISMQLAQEALGDSASSSSSITVESIQKRVADFFNLTVGDLTSGRRHKVVAQPRQIAMYLSRKLTSCSFPQIGHSFGGKDHTTVVHAVQKIDRCCSQDAQIRATVTTLEQSLML